MGGWGGLCGEKGEGVTGWDVGWAASRSPPINLHITADRMVLITY